MWSRGPNQILTGKLAELQEPMDKSKAIYDRVRERLRTTDGFQELLDVPEKRNADLTQASDEFDTVYFKQAPKAQQKLTSLIASEWQVDLHPPRPLCAAAPSARAPARGTRRASGQANRSGST